MTNEPVINYDDVSIKLLITKIKLTLTNLGASEKYIAFNYLSDILIYFILCNNDSHTIYKQALLFIQDKYNLTERSVIGGLQQIMKTCGKDKFSLKPQFQLVGNSILNKIRVIRAYIENLL